MGHSSHGTSPFVGALGFSQSPSTLQRDSAVWGIWGQEGPSLEVESPAASQCCQCVPVLSHSLACLLLVVIYLPPRCPEQADCAELLRWPGGCCQLCQSPAVLGVFHPEGRERQSYSCESSTTTSSHQKRAWLQGMRAAAQGKPLSPLPQSPWLPDLLPEPAGGQKEVKKHILCCNYILLLEILCSA